jgi:hypothetical protein
MRGFAGALLSVVSLIAIGGCGSDSTTGEAVPSREVDELTKKDLRALNRAALRDPLVRQLIAGSDPKVLRPFPWSREGGPRYMGAGVHLRINPPIDLDAQVLPAYATPNSDAPAGTPDLRLKVVYTSKGVKELVVRVLAVGREVVEIQPEAAESSDAEWFGPSPGEDYVPEGD